ncbi:MAG: hypothetical protein IT426_12210 [Pirellulales bacterium]|nr:hypothetical protein [Pirellulales bacterium]
MGYDKNRLADLLKKIYKFTVEGADIQESPCRYRIIGGSGTKISFATENGSFEGMIPEGRGPTLTILPEGMSAYDEFVYELQKDEEFRYTIGSGAVEEQLKSYLQHTNGQLPSNEDIKDIVRYKIIKPLRDGIQSWISFIPVINLVVTAPLELGDVTFVSQETALSESQDFIQEHQFAGDEERQEEQRHVISEQLLNGNNQYSAFAKVLVRCHENRAAEVAADKALISLNIIRSHIHLFHVYNDKSLIGLPSELPQGYWQAISLSPGDKHTFHVQNIVAGPLLPFVLDAQKKDHLTNTCGLKIIQDILALSSEKRNTLQSAIIQAFQALGRAIVAPTVDMRFLGCTIALERMLIRDNEETTTERWSDRLAVVLSKDVEQRRRIVQRAKKLYELRSRIVHAAYSGVSESDARTMERWAVGLILCTLGRQHEFTSHEEFCKKNDPREIGFSHVGCG